MTLMNKLLTVIVFVLTSFNLNAQTEGELIDFAARICTTDSVSITLGYNVEDDSLKRFDFITPNLAPITNSVFEYDDFILDVNLNSSMLFNGTPYGKLYIINFSKKEAQVLVLLSGVGDRVKNKQWNYAVYSFLKQKKGRWYLDKVNYKYGEVATNLLEKQ